MAPAALVQFRIEHQRLLIEAGDQHIAGAAGVDQPQDGHERLGTGQPAEIEVEAILGSPRAIGKLLFSRHVWLRARPWGDRYGEREIDALVIRGLDLDQALAFESGVRGRRSRRARPPKASSPLQSSRKGRRVCNQRSPRRRCRSGSTAVMFGVSRTREAPAVEKRGSGVCDQRLAPKLPVRRADGFEIVGTDGGQRGKSEGGRRTALRRFLSAGDCADQHNGEEALLGTFGRGVIAILKGFTDEGAISASSPLR